MFKWLREFISWLKDIFWGNNSAKQQRQGESKDLPKVPLKVRIIGPRGCGKTTYFGAVLVCPSRASLIKNIIAVGPKSREFETDAENILKNGGVFNPTPNLVSGVAELKEVRFTLTIAPDNKQSPTEITIFSKDYPGEILDNFNVMDRDMRLKYMNDCAESTGILLLVEATQYGKDSDYAISIKKFVEDLISAKDGGWKGKIAFGVTKCEEPEIYIEHTQKGSYGLIESYFPKTLNALMMACYNRDIQIGYFAMSAFGMRPLSLEPNVEMKPDPIDPNRQVACLWYPNVWRPFGLFEPLYWLGTGKLLEFNQK
jgi:hypothetical protein